MTTQHILGRRRNLQLLVDPVVDARELLEREVLRELVVTHPLRMQLRLDAMADGAVHRRRSAHAHALNDGQEEPAFGYLKAAVTPRAPEARPDVVAPLLHGNVGPLLHEDDAVPGVGQHTRRSRAARAAADDDEVGLVLNPRLARHHRKDLHPIGDPLRLSHDARSPQPSSERGNPAARFPPPAAPRQRSSRPSTPSS